MLNQKEAAASLGMSVHTFRTRVRPYIKCVVLNHIIRFPVGELERWVAENAKGQ
jgi:hypothetical protein